MNCIACQKPITAGQHYFIRPSGNRVHDDCAIVKEDRSEEALLGLTHTSALALHARALACHCECLGMNAENCTAATLNQTTPYGMEQYLAVMKKWGILTEKGEPNT